MKNRWLIAVSAIGIHISIGSVYAWSVFNMPLETTFGWENSYVGELFGEKTAIALTFSLAIFFLGISAAIMGNFVEKHGPKKSGLIAGTFWGIGLIIAGLGTHLENIYLLWLGYGVFGGIGLGIGYITPVSTLVKWFPDRRGLATGLAIMGFGFGALIGAPIFQMLIVLYSIPITFVVIGVVYLIIMYFSAIYLAPPPQGWILEKMKKAVASGTIKVDLTQQTANQAVKTKPFWGLWVMMFINITCGIGIIYSASPLLQESIGITAIEAAAVVGLMAFFNGMGRLGWATASDYLGRANTYLIFFLIQIIAFFLLPNITNLIIFQVVLFIILTCYGGGFASLPAFIGDLFGTKKLGAIHGYVLTAWALAGIAGPIITSQIREITGSYELTLYVFGSTFILATFVAILMKLYISRASSQCSF